MGCTTPSTLPIGRSAREQQHESFSLLRNSLPGRDETIASQARCYPMTQTRSQSVPVLIVEDDPLVRMDTASFLEGEGFAVFEADDAATAIRSLELHEEIRLVFTDVNMPGWMNGLALAHYIRGRWPPVKIVVTSGCVKARQDGLPTETLFIEKPYDPTHVAEKLKELVDA
jgi:two-component system, response regulator PdtaR